MNNKVRRRSGQEVDKCSKTRGWKECGCNGSQSHLYPEEGKVMRKTIKGLGEGKKKGFCYDQIGQNKMKTRRGRSRERGRRKKESEKIIEDA